MQSPHSYIPSCGQILCFSCSAAEGVTEECILRVLLLTLQCTPSPRIGIFQKVDFSKGRFDLGQLKIFFKHEYYMFLSIPVKSNLTPPPPPLFLPIYISRLSNRVKWKPPIFKFKWNFDWILGQGNILVQFNVPPPPPEMNKLDFGSR